MKGRNIESQFISKFAAIQYIDNSLGYPIKTRISYKFGLYNGKQAVAFYINGKFADLRIRKSLTNQNFKFYKCGGQTFRSSRRQREKCLELVTRVLFEKYGFEVKLKPHLSIYQPDMMIRNKNLTCYIELKAYHRSYICGDPEISQIMKYHRAVLNLTDSEKIKLKIPDNLKFLLITSGSLIKPQDSYLNNPKVDPIQFVRAYYKNLIIPRSKIKTLEDFSARDIYKQAAIKVKKNYGKGFPNIKLVFLNKNSLQNFPSCLNSNEKFDILIIGSNVFYELLKKQGLNNEANKFNLLRKTAIEMLIINGSILKIKV